MKRLISYLVWWSGWIAVSLILAGNLSWIECVAEAAVAALATAAVRTGSLHTRSFAPKFDWVANLRSLPGQILADCGTVATALWQRGIGGQNVTGSLRDIPFEPGKDDGRSAARRAVVTGALSLAPNTYVVAIDCRHRALIVHQLVPDQTSGRRDRRWPL